MRSVALVVWVAGALGALAGCREPTEVTVALSTDLACGAAAEQLGGVGIAVGAPSGVDGLDDATETSPGECAGGALGDIVLVPSGSNDASFGLRVVGGVGVDVDRCLREGFAPKGLPAGSGCIVARRSLGFLPHQPLHLPIRLEKSCIGQACAPDSTCYHGACVTASIDPNDCTSTAGCTPPDPGAGGGGVGGAGGGGVGGAGGAGGDAGNGTVLWAKRWGASGFAFATAMSAVLDGVDLAGRYRGALDTGSAALSVPASPPNATNGFALRFDGSDGATTRANFARSTQDAPARFDAMHTIDTRTVLAGSAAVAVTLAEGTWPVQGQAPFVFEKDVATSLVTAAKIMSGSVHRFDRLAVDATTTYAVAFTDGSFDLGAQFDSPFPLEGNPFVAKLAAPFWQLPLPPSGPAGSSPASIALSADGITVASNIAHAGTYGFGITTLAPHDADVLLARIEPLTGGWVWATSFGDAARQVAHDVAVGPLGRIALGGELEGSIDFGGATHVAVGQVDGFVALLPPAAIAKPGTALWSKSFGKAGSTVRVWTVAVRPDGGVVVGGSFDGSVDFGMGELSAPAGTRSAFVAIYDSSGTPLMTRAFGGPSHVACDAKNGLDPADRCYFAATSLAGTFFGGNFAGEIDLDGTGAAATPAGTQGFFVVKIEP